MPFFSICLLTLAVLAAHAGKYPHFAGFWAGVDQQRYLEAARAWAHLDVTPARHHYLPLYPLMAAPFVWLTPWQPFMLPDLACLLASLLLFVCIAARLAPGWPPGIAAICFVLAAMGSKTLLGLWIVPWSSTGAAPFQFAAVLLALRFGERPDAARAASVGLAIAVIGGIRPSDAAVLLVTCGVYMICMLLRGHAAPRSWLAAASGGAGGLAAGLLAVAALHGLVFGLSPGPYLADSAAIGFEWRLLPVRWVMLVIDPRPLLPEGSGMVEHWPWIIPGLAGMLLAIMQGRSSAAAPSLLAAGTVALHWALYLAYRDMHAYGLWRFYNIHYFKWTFPFLIFWAAQFGWAIGTAGQRPRALAALSLTLLLFAWRPILRKPLDIPVHQDGQRIALPATLRLNEALLLPVTAICGDAPKRICAPAAAWTAIYFAQTDFAVDGRDYVTKRDTKLLPVPGGAMLIALRRLPSGPATLVLPENLRIDASRPAKLFRQAVVFGIP